MPAQRLARSIAGQTTERREDWEDLIGRLYRAGENAVLALTDDLSPQQRVDLAAFCYRKAHLHGIGLAIAATCDRSTLMQMLGTALGDTMWAQSRERPVDAVRPLGAARAKVTLAKFDPRPVLGIDPEPSDPEGDGHDMAAAEVALTA